ncbi:MAG: alpha-glucosidase [Lachnospiraceae bacterium]|nr:alpha-glucosidase [Lachnospiraceae bacterium]
MIKRSRFGNPIETEAIINKPEAVEFSSKRLIRTDNGFIINLSEKEMVFGLGENVRGINKRGHIYKSYCDDNPNHQEDTMTLYGAHNFFVLSDSKLGVFLDTPSEITFDIGYTKASEFRIEINKQDFDLYIIEGESIDKVVQEFRGLIGRSYIPPRWSFGYGQCRWSYMSSDEVRTVAENYEKNNMPIDMIYLDIDYMERYKDFTVNKDTFGDLDQLISEMKAKNIHLVPIIDAGIKVEEGYDVYEEGREKGYFCKDADGEDFIVGVWPGRCCFPDMLNSEARAWFGNKYKVLTDMGIDGFWNDMNEPAIFYSEKKLKEAFGKIKEFEGSNLGVDKFFELRDIFNRLGNSREDYASFYHNYRGQKVCHNDVHNLFGYYMTRGASEAFERISPDKRILMFSRASYVGMHRYGGIWQGDNKSWWSHLLMNLKMMPSLNMCGFLYTGADVGGFGSNTTEDLMLRWLQLAVFTPLMRNHSAMGTRRQELYAFEGTERFKKVLDVRYKLLPYIYSEFMKSALKNTMMFRPLAFEYTDDEIACHVEDQLLLGESIMIAPIVEQNAIGRTVYIPERMQLVRFKDGEVISEKIYEKGHAYVEAALDEVILFVRENRILPLSEGGKNVTETNFNDLSLIAFGDEIKPYEYYNDDGESPVKDDYDKYISVLSK